MKRILVVAPHPDDEMIGVGGTIIKNIALGNEVNVCIVTKGCLPLFSPEDVETVQREAIRCHAMVGVAHTYCLNFPAAMLEEVHRYELNGKLLEVVNAVRPDSVYIPHPGDLQKDHKIVAESCMVALRPKYASAPKRIYAYETLSETGWDIPSVNNAFIPNAYVDISEHLDKKIEAMQIYHSQLGAFPEARSVEAIESLARYRGSVMNLDAAEAFATIREIN